MTETSARPFYARFAWAYDLLVADPVEPWADAVCEAAGASHGARILDAGCGTARHAAELARRGHRVVLVDASPWLLAVARERLPDAEAHVTDLRTLALGDRFDAVACRGVLNDLVEDEDRQAALDALARHVADRGALILDVREADASLARYRDGIERDRVVQTDRGELRYRSRGWADGDLLRFEECHELRSGSQTEAAEHEFAMRPWAPDELRRRVAAAGLAEVRIQAGVGRRTADRLLCVAA